jgi:hypothetical protein
MKLRLLTSFVAASAFLVPTSAALAAPANAPSSASFLLMCGGTNYSIVVNTGHAGSNGRGNPLPLTPGFIVQGGSGLLMPLSLTITFTSTDTSTTPPTVQTFTNSATRGNAQAVGLGGTTTCTFSQSQTVGTVTFTIDGTVTVVSNSNAHT